MACRRDDKNQISNHKEFGNYGTGGWGETTHNIHAHLRNGVHIEMGRDDWVQIFPNNVHNRGH